MQFENVKLAELNVAPFKATHILRPDLLVLSRSLFEFGFIAPLIVQKKKNVIIDGNERFLLATKEKNLASEIGDSCPVVFIECDDLEAQLMHLRLNRGRGNLLAKQTSKIIRNLINSGHCDKDDLENRLQMKTAEFNLMIDGSLIKHRNIGQHSYSRAWVPVEADPSIVSTPMTIEVPPNADR